MSKSSVSPAWGWPASGSHIVSSRTRSSRLQRERFPRTPSSISTWDGAAETVLGVALVARKTRKSAHTCIGRRRHRSPHAG